MEMHRLMCEKTACHEMDDAELHELLTCAYADDQHPPVTRLVRSMIFMICNIANIATLTANM